MEENINAEVIGVFPDKIKISVDDLENFSLANESLKVGSYLRVLDNENAVLIAIIENFSIEVKEDEKKKYIIEATPLGLIIDGKFQRGGDTIAIPPKRVEPAKREEIEKIFMDSIEKNKKFVFAKLSTDNTINVPVDGNKFFNKHIAIVGSTGSGKSHTVAKIVQEAINSKDNGYNGLNNSHIVIFDIHSEYKSAFPNANCIDIDNLILPYWLLNSDELQELFIDTEANDHNQRNVFKESVVSNRKKYFDGSDKEKDKIHFDSPLFFEINDILKDAKDKNEEMVPGARDTMKAGPLNGKLSNFVSRLENKINDKRLEFLLGDRSKKITFEETLKQLISYDSNKSNVTIIDLSGIPFEVLSITVSLISRILFEYGYYYKRLRCKKNPNENVNNDVPILLVYEEAHKYVPNSDLSKYRASKQSIERIAKEGRKYGVSMLLASQRPSEISETIFSQCNNFIAMRLTNPTDQNYVKKLLPDTYGGLINKMPTLKAGESLLIGDSIIVPSMVQIDECENKPSSSDIPYFELWKEEWKDLDIQSIKDEWYK
ncbi:MAG: ATP-binding protein [Clostridia bacterium]|nr:ATP-binding protein [Clostridia bacterium]